MKRHAELLELSREHHAALKLARHARNAADSGEVAEIRRVAQRAVDLFATELDPHFVVEEQGLLVFLAQVGESALVARTLAEHQTLRELAGGLQQPDAATLLRFSEVLAAHVRFEERELFETTQACLEASGASGLLSAQSPVQAG